MSVQRNVEGLRQNAQKKRQEALEKVEQGIRQLIKEGRPINFNTVAQAADVSKAFLYKEQEIKERIDQLRQQGSKKKLEPKQRASDASKDAVIKTLRERLKKLEAEVRGLRRQNEIAYGQVIEVSSLRQQVGRLQAENDRLRQQLLIDSPPQASQITISDLEAEIRSLGVQLNTTILKRVQETPPEITKRAIESLKEAITENRVENRAGFLARALQDGWEANKELSAKPERDIFNEWYDLACQAGLVIGSIEEDHEQYVYKPNGEPCLFSEMLGMYPLSALKQ